MNEAVVVLPVWAPYVGVACLAFLAWMARGGCRCEKCSFHVNEARVLRDKRRGDQHRHRHNMEGIAWGDENRCQQCREGRADDQHAR